MLKSEFERKRVSSWVFKEMNKDLGLEKFSLILITHWADEERERKLFSGILLN